MNNNESDLRLVNRLRLVSRIIGAIVALSGCLVLIGWFLDIPVLKSPHPSLITMKANTALCFLLIGIALYLLGRDRVYPALGGTLRSTLYAKRIAFICAFLITCIGLLSLGEYLFSVNLGIDQLLVVEPAGAVGTVHPGRMAPNTALNFILIGLALLLLDVETRRGYRPTQFLIAAEGIIALLALIGYSYNVSEFTGLASYTRMALNTMILFVLICFGVLFARPDLGLMSIFTSDSLGGKMARWIMPVAVFILFITGWLRLWGQRSGLYPGEFGTSIRLVADIIIFVVFLYVISKALHKADAERQSAKDELQASHDILEIKVQQRTAELRRLNRTLATLSKCNQTLVMATDEQQFTRDICRTVVELGGYRMAWVGYAQNNGQQKLNPVASAGYEDGFMEIIQRCWDDAETRHCPSYNAFQTGRPVITRDIGHISEYVAWRPEALKRGYASAISLPLIAQAKVFGMLNIYSSEPEVFDEPEVKLLSEMALDLGHGITTLRDLQEKKRVEKEMLFVSKIPSGNPNPIMCVDFNGILLYANQAGDSILSAKSQVGKMVSDKWRDWVNAVFESKAGREFEMELGNRVFSFVLTPVSEDNYVIVYGRDVTEQKKTQSQLFQAQKLESVGTLAGGIAHDFNNMIGAIKGYAELSLMDLSAVPNTAQAGTEKSNPVHEPSPCLPELTPKMQQGLGEYLRHIVTATDRAGVLTRQLLIFSRGHSSELQSLNLNETVANMLKMLNRLIGEDIKIETKLALDAAAVKADAGNIEQVLLNLVVNARDAMPTGGKITIKTENVAVDEKYCQLNIESRCGDFVILTVSDTGSGMSKEVLSHMFEPFFTTKPQGKGTGLGLSVVYGIVKKHNGWLNVYSEPAGTAYGKPKGIANSEPGQGSVFKIYLPVSAEKPQAKSDTRVIPVNQLRGKSEKVLVVEDDEGIRNLVTNALAKMNYQVFTAASGAEARTLFEKEKGVFHFILSDVVLPDTNGVELCDELSAKNKNVCVLLSSGYASRGAYSEQIRARNLPFIQKPYKLNELFKTIREMLEGKQ
ncbi:MAG: GAF domain-containing protein [Planctomycetes bacterium]|nr:GAF domain-containing protein [Planctomycetota bacterium]